MRKRIKQLVPAVGLAFGAVGLLAAGSAHADPATSSPITSFYQIVADAAHSHLFISQGSSSYNHIIVTNLAGQEVTTIAGQDGVKGIALSPDGSTLYAALSAAHAVTAIDTTTLQQTASYPLGNANTPMDVAVQSGKIWVSYDNGTAGSAAIGDIDLSANQPAFQTQAAMGGWYGAPQLAADSKDTGVLVAAEPGMSPSSVASYDTTVDPATVRAKNTFFQGCSNESDLAVAPGGLQFILACGAPYAHYRYLTADLSQQGSYASTNYPDAVAVDAAGDVAAGTANNPSSPDLYIYRQGGDTPLNTYNLASSGASLAARGLAWSPDGTKVFAVLHDSGYSVRVIDGPTLIRPTLSLTTGRTTFTYEPTIHVTAHLGRTFSNRTVSIYAQVFGRKSKTLVKTGRVNSSGNLTVSYTAPHSTTFSVVFAGDAHYAPATVTHVVYVRAKVSESLSGYYHTRRIGGVTYRLYHRRDLLHAHATVGPNKAGQCVKFEVQEFYHGAWHGNVTTTCRKLSSSSKVSVAFGLTRADIGYHYRIRADYIRSSTDTTNLSNDSAWQHLIVER